MGRGRGGRLQGVEDTEKEGTERGNGAEIEGGHHLQAVMSSSALPDGTQREKRIITTDICCIVTYKSPRCQADSSYLEVWEP